MIDFSGAFGMAAALTVQRIEGATGRGAGAAAAAVGVGSAHAAQASAKGDVTAVRGAAGGGGGRRAGCGQTQSLADGLDRALNPTSDTPAAPPSHSTRARLRDAARRSGTSAIGCTRATRYTRAGWPGCGFC